MDRNELKVQALLEKISQITTQYENQLADYRVEITVLSQQLSEANTELNTYKGSNVETEEVPSESTDSE